MRPTVKELAAHPAFKSAHWELSATRSGFSPVAAGRGGPFNISWEVHGNGPTKLVVRDMIFPL